MKLERTMKQYYTGRVNSIDLPEMTGIPHRTAVHPAKPWSDMVLGCAMHAALALAVAFGLPALRNESLLSARITRMAEEASLDKHIESRVKLLSENIITIRNTK